MKLRHSPRGSDFPSSQFERQKLGKEQTVLSEEHSGLAIQRAWKKTEDKLHLPVPGQALSNRAERRKSNLMAAKLEKLAR